MFLSFLLDSRSNIMLDPSQWMNMLDTIRTELYLVLRCIEESFEKQKNYNQYKCEIRFHTEK